MYLERVKAKGRYYLYLRKYKVRRYYESNKKTIYGFGRIDNALTQMYEWRNNFTKFPQELIDRGCTYDDLLEWIDTLENGVHKTGRTFDPVI